MTAITARMEFAPPPTKGLLRAFGLAIVAHGLLLMVLTLGLQWKRDPVLVTVEAELWSALPVQAAPPAVPEPTPIPPEPVPEPKPVIAPPTPLPPAVDPSIAIAQEKARLQKEKQLQAEIEKRQKDAQLAKKRLEEMEVKAKREQELRDKLARDRKLQLEQQKAQTARADAETRKLAELRQEQIDRMNRLAGQAVGSGPPDTGKAKQSSGPSAGYEGRIAARIKPNITYTEMIFGNPAADVEVRTSPDGTIISRKLVKSSGVKSWDDAVLNAVDKTEKLPPDTNGRVIPSLILGFRPRD